MTPLDEINLQIERKMHEISPLERAYRHSMKLYKIIQDLVDLAELRMPDVNSQQDLGWHAFLNEYCTVSIALPRQFGKTTALMHWYSNHKNCLVWMPTGSDDRVDVSYPNIKGTRMIDENFSRIYRGTKKQVDYLLIDEHHSSKTDSLSALQSAIIGQNLSANKPNPSFITIKVGTPR